jgi:hypothetical protein
MDTIARKNEKCRTCGKQFSQGETIRITAHGKECKDTHNCIMRFLRKKGVSLPGRNYRFVWEA